MIKTNILYEATVSILFTVIAVICISALFVACTTVSYTRTLSDGVTHEVAYQAPPWKEVYAEMEVTSDTVHVTYSGRYSEATEAAKGTLEIIKAVSVMSAGGK